MSGVCNLLSIMELCFAGSRWRDGRRLLAKDDSLKRMNLKCIKSSIEG